MSYCEYPPHKALVNYIDAYWTIKTGSERQSTLHRILPDGCTDIIFNRGHTIYKPDQQEALCSDESYIIGTMTSFSETIQTSENSILGIRFKPGGISGFYHLNLEEITDLAMPYQDIELREIIYRAGDLLSDLNFYFLRKLPSKPLAIAPVIVDIGLSNGRIKVSELTKRHAMSERKLERLFKKDVGVSIKGMIRLIRVTNTIRVIQNNVPQQGFSQIAYTAGYYDQAHLCSEIKQYTGLTPTQL
jgi:AraC-like DNA-binding protein